MESIEGSNAFGSWKENHKTVDTIASTEEENQAVLWHCRLDYMSQKGMKILQLKGKQPELKNIDLDICESCILGKQKKLSFLKASKTLRPRKLELVHTDL